MAASRSCSRWARRSSPWSPAGRRLAGHGPPTRPHRPCRDLRRGPARARRRRGLHRRRRADRRRAVAHGPAPGGLRQRSRRAHRGRDLPRPHRPPRPHRLQQPAALVSPGPDRALHLALPVARRSQLRGHDLRPGQRARRAGRQGAPEVPGDEGRRRRDHGDPGHGQDRASVRGLARAQHRARDLHDQAQDGLRLGAAAARRERLQGAGRAPEKQARLRVPPLRGHRSEARRRVQDDEHGALSRPGPGGDPLHGAGTSPTTTSGPRSAARSCGRRSPTCGSTATRPTCSPRARLACASAWAPTGRRRARRTSSAS